ncbi:hypothetical protein Tco_0730412 [Tanacetum coccineum]|uniref:Uncharacterized protein n=1 Tax=Tanacetum coccineum TaxID=301880 RepID=A0ABQ4YSW6_9ASTR
MVRLRSSSSPYFTPRVSARDFTMSTSSLQAEKTVYTSLTLFSDTKLNGRDEKKRLDHLKKDQEMLVIKIFSERKKVFKERKKCEKIRAKSDFSLGLLVEFFDLWKLGSPLDTVVEGLMSNVPNEGSIYKLKLCCDITKASMLHRSVEVNLRGLLGLGKVTSAVMNIKISLVPPELSPSSPS